MSVLVAVVSGTYVLLAEARARIVHRMCPPNGVYVSCSTGKVCAEFQGAGRNCFRDMVYLTLMSAAIELHFRPCHPDFEHDNVIKDRRSGKVNE